MLLKLKQKNNYLKLGYIYIYIFVPKLNRYVFMQLINMKHILFFVLICSLNMYCDYKISNYFSRTNLYLKMGI